MSQSALKLEVATPKGLVLSVEASVVQAPGIAGEFGVLPGHLPVLSALRCGLLTYSEGGKSHVAAIDRGFAEAGPAKLLVLTEAFATKADIDVEATRTELAEAEKRLAAVKEPTESAAYQEALRDVQWADAKLRVASTVH